MTTFTSSVPQDAAELRPDYRAVNPWAVVSLVFGVLSVVTALHWFFLLIPLTGMFAGWKALRQFREYAEVQTGTTLAYVGMAVSLLFGLSGAAILQFVVRDVPSGYKEIDFSDLQPGSNEFVPQYALDLQPTMSSDQKIFIRGYIYPGRRTRDLKEFLLVPTVGHCAFCSSRIRSTELIRVKLVSDYTVDYRTTQIGVGGRLRVHLDAARNPMGQSPYSLEADYVH